VDWIPANRTSITSRIAAASSAFALAFPRVSFRAPQKRENGERLEYRPALSGYSASASWPQRRMVP